MGFAECDNELEIKDRRTAVSRHQAVVGMTLNVKYYSRILYVLRTKLGCYTKTLWPFSLKLSRYKSF